MTLRTQLVSSGHTKDLLATANGVTFHMHCYGPKGGSVTLQYSSLDQLDMICQRLSGEKI